MQNIEPYYRWRDDYVASEDESSPFYGREYSEFEYSQTIYNYYIHPQWDNMGSSTLYIKILFVDYDEQYAIIELLGEWNDCIENDIMTFKRNIIDYMLGQGIKKFILIGENVLNFHADDESYYEEWYEDVIEESGWVAMINIRQHVEDEMMNNSLHLYINLGSHLNNVAWRPLKPIHVLNTVEYCLRGGRQLSVG
jgi:hypothetical protein